MLFGESYLYQTIQICLNDSIKNFYKHYFYKQLQAKIDKKLGES